MFLSVLVVYIRILYCILHMLEGRDNFLSLYILIAKLLPSKFANYVSRIISLLHHVAIQDKTSLECHF